MDSHPRLYLTAAFFCGVLLTLGFKDFYPDLEGRFRRKRTSSDTLASAGLRKENQIDLQDHTGTQKADERDNVELAEGIEACVGNTPLIRIKSLSQETGCDILAKAEVILSTRVRLVPQGFRSLQYAEQKATRPISSEKSDVLRMLGAVVDRVPPAPIVDPMHFVNRARNLAADHTADPKRLGRGYFADQFENKANWQAHFEGTGPEIFRQCGGKVDAFVAGAGTGGTIAGVARFLKPRIPNLRIVLADPQGSGLFNRIKFGVMFDTLEKEGTRRRSQVDSIVEGIGINRVTVNFEAGRELIDDAIKVSDEEASGMARWLVEKDGIFVGSSSCVNCKLYRSTPSVTD
ncbi:MAG: hypothetical protein Q9219_002014 [cf. Caloplaca sp. 3 TL-2023]